MSRVCSYVNKSQFGLKMYVWNPIEIKEREKEVSILHLPLHTTTTTCWHCRHYIEKIHQPMHIAHACILWLWAYIVGQSYSVRLASHVCGWEWWIMYTNFYQNLFDSLVTFNLYTSAFKVWAYCSYHVMNETRLLLLNGWSACGYSSLLLPIIITVHYYVKANTFVMRM